MPTDVKIFNRKLKEVYGKHLDGRQLFRLIWSESELEKRYGTYNVFYGNIYIRTETGVLEVRKYNYIKERYILERLVYMPSREIVGSENGHYECVYVFQDKDGNYLKPIWKALEYICHKLLHGRVVPKSESILANEEKDAMDKETAEFLDYLNQEQSPLAAALADKEAVSYAGLNAKEK